MMMIIMMIIIMMMMLMMMMMKVIHRNETRLGFVSWNFHALRSSRSTESSVAQYLMAPSMDFPSNGTSMGMCQNPRGCTYVIYICHINVIYIYKPHQL